MSAVQPGIALDANAAWVEKAMAETRRAAWRNTAGHAMLVTLPLLFGLGGFGVGAYALHELRARPVLPPEVHVAFVYPDSYLGPVLRSKLAPEQWDVVLENSAANFVRCSEEYVWESVGRCYKIVSAMLTPDLRAAYQARMNDPKDPQNPQVRYGTGALAPKVRIVGKMNVHRDKRRAPNTFVVAYTVVEERSGKPATVHRKIARLNWADASDTIPADIQRESNPAGIAVTWFALDDDQNPTQEPN